MGRPRGSRNSTVLVNPEEKKKDGRRGGMRKRLPVENYMRIAKELHRMKNYSQMAEALGCSITSVKTAQKHLEEGVLGKRVFFPEEENNVLLAFQQLEKDPANAHLFAPYQPVI